MSKDKEKDAWIAGVHSADRIFRETIREARKTLPQEGFLRWLDGFVSEKKSDKQDVSDKK